MVELLFFTITKDKKMDFYSNVIAQGYFFKSRVLQVNVSSTVDNVKFTFAPRTQLIKKWPRIITLDEQSML